MAALGFSCRCGQLHGTVEIGPHSGTHLVCHCGDCRRAMDHFGIPGTREEGVDLFQTTPDRIRIAAGQDQLALLRLSPRGLMRWYARCCGTPLFNTTSTPLFSFVGVLTRNLEGSEALGPVVAHGFVDDGTGKSRHVHGGRVVRGLLSRAAGALISGRWRQTPFFDPATRAPVAEAELAPRQS